MCGVISLLLFYALKEDIPETQANPPVDVIGDRSILILLNLAGALGRLVGP